MNGFTSTIKDKKYLREGTNLNTSRSFYLSYLKSKLLLCNIIIFRSCTERFRIYCCKETLYTESRIKRRRFIHIITHAVEHKNVTIKLK